MGDDEAGPTSSASITDGRAAPVGPRQPAELQFTPNQRKGDFGEAFVSALAISAGLLVSRHSNDVDGIDWTITFPGMLGGRRSPKIEVQVKTTSVPRPLGAENWTYQLKAKNFNALVDKNVVLPRYLVLVTVPASDTDYVSASERALSLRHAAYWTSLADREPVSTRSRDQRITVHVPRRNLLTPGVLLQLLAGEGEPR